MLSSKSDSVLCCGQQIREVCQFLEYALTQTRLEYSSISQATLASLNLLAVASTLCRDN